MRSSRLAVLTTLSLVFGAAFAPRHARSADDVPAVSESAPAKTPQGASSPEAAAGEPDQHFYGWQNMLVGSGGIVIGAIGVATSKDAQFEFSPVFVVGAGIFVLGSPIVHVAHGHVGRAVGSLLLNAALPTVGGMFGIMTAKCRGPEECNADYATPMYVGIFTGMIAATLLDGLLMGFEDAPKPEPPASGVSAPQPWLAIGARDAQGISTTRLGVAGAF